MTSCEFPHAAQYRLLVARCASFAAAPGSLRCGRPIGSASAPRSAPSRARQPCLRWHSAHRPAHVGVRLRELAEAIERAEADPGAESRRADRIERRWLARQRREWRRDSWSARSTKGTGVSIDHRASYFTAHGRSDSQRHEGAHCDRPCKRAALRTHPRRRSREDPRANARRSRLTQHAVPASMLMRAEIQPQRPGGFMCLAPKLRDSRHRDARVCSSQVGGLVFMPFLSLILIGGLSRVVRTPMI